jgi:hypothetical protein
LENNKMREIEILHNSLVNYCPEIHLKRVNSLIVGCHALLLGNRLTLTELGRNIDSQCRTKHSIKRMDRLLGNSHLHDERLAVYRWYARQIISSNPMPIVLVDWADVREHQRLMVLRASVALRGRSITLYERTFELKEHNTDKAHKQFLHDLKQIIPSSATPLIVTDAGYKNPWFRAVEAHNWFWLARVRGGVNYTPSSGEKWQPIRTLHGFASQKTKHIGRVRLAKSSPILCELYTYKGRNKGRKGKRSTTTNSHHPSHKEYQKSAREPWVLATNLPEQSFNGCQLVKLYRKRMQIEETFRDLKSPAYGFGLRHSRSRCPKRFDVLLLIALLVQLVLWWIGLYARHAGWSRYFQANTERKKTVLSTLRLAREVRKRPEQYLISDDNLKWAQMELIRQLLKQGCAVAKL